MVKKNKTIQLVNKKAILLIGVILAIFYLILFFKNNRNAPITEKKINVITDKNNYIGCTRTSRLDNLPQYDRALSLIQQRLIVNQERFKYNKRSLFTSFVPNLTNCIKVVEEQSTESNPFEGYFTFNGKDIKSNYFPIIVNSKYVQSDDILIALLLTHEMTHVQQYIDSVNNIKTLSCIDKEVNAFLATRMFYISGLNEEEMNAVSLRIYEAVDNNDTSLSYSLNRPFDGQLLMLEAIQNLYSSPLLSCEPVKNPSANDTSWKKFGSYLECVDSEVPILLKEIIEKDKFYKKECGL